VAQDCLWNKADTTANTNLKDVGEPPTTGIPKTGTETMTIVTNLGTVTASLDLAKAPCTAASFKYLGSKGFFNNTSCHRLLEETTDHVLQCGDPSGTGSGGPGYTFGDEYLPSNPSATTATNCASPSASDSVTYPGGSIAMANGGADTNGSQFFIVYKDSTFPPCYTLFGTITGGLKLVQQVGAAGADGSSGDGKPKKAVKITSLTVSGPNPASPSPSTQSPSPAATASASGQSPSAQS
jgi:peptidyl-prolyl cis-trans isomerase B (cyclophilin B)